MLIYPNTKPISRLIISILFVVMVLTILLWFVHGSVVHSIMWFFWFCSLGFVIIYLYLLIKLSKSIIVVDQLGIRMDNCALLLKDNSMCKPVTLEVGWDQVAEVGKRFLVLITGEVYVASYNYARIIYSTRGFSKYTIPSPFKSEDWNEIVRYFEKYKNNIQE